MGGEGRKSFASFFLEFGVEQVCDIEVSIGALDQPSLHSLAFAIVPIGGGICEIVKYGLHARRGYLVHLSAAGKSATTAGGAAVRICAIANSSLVYDQRSDRGPCREASSPKTSDCHQGRLSKVQNRPKLLGVQFEK
jgi:hypothetical protein